MVYRCLNLLPVVAFILGGCGDDASTRDAGTRPDVPRPDVPQAGLCTDTCGPADEPGGWANDGECDDGGEGSANSACMLGSDCGDCGSRVPAMVDGGAPDAGRPDAGNDAGRSYPAICDNLAMSCPDAASFMACEAGTAGFGPCTYLPLTFGCATGGCPSDAQVCRTGERPDGYCTHPCSDESDCPIEGGGVGSCDEVNPGLFICITN